MITASVTVDGNAVPQVFVLENIDSADSVKYDVQERMDISSPFSLYYIDESGKETEINNDKEWRWCKMDFFARTNTSSFSFANKMKMEVRTENYNSSPEREGLSSLMRRLVISVGPYDGSYRNDDYENDEWRDENNRSEISYSKQSKDSNNGDDGNDYNNDNDAWGGDNNDNDSNCISRHNADSNDNDDNDSNGFNNDNDNNDSDNDDNGDSDDSNDSNDSDNNNSNHTRSNISTAHNSRALNQLFSMPKNRSTFKISSNNSLRASRVSGSIYFAGSIRFAGRISTDRSNQVVHASVLCDECQQNPIVGTRFKSISRIDFDLCEKCANLPKYSQELFIRVPFYKEHLNQKVFMGREFERFRRFVERNLD